jgi:hypothetical protein
MISKILLRLIDETIVPAILVVVTKILGMWLVTFLFNIEWQISLTVGTKGIEFANREGLLMVNSYSNLLVMFVLTLGLLWLLAQAYHFHESHISPAFTLKLFSLNLTKLITSSVEIYHKALVWLSYLWLVVLLTFVHMVMGISYGWVTGVSFALAAFLTWLFVNDLERELPV